MPAVAIDFRNLASLDEELAHANATLAASDSTPEWVEDLVQGVAEELRDLDPEAWRETVDPYLLVELGRVAIAALLALESDDEGIKAETVEISLEAMRDILHDIRENSVVAEGQSPQQVSRWLKETMRASTQETADLLSVRKRTFERWLAGQGEPHGDDAMRLALGARLVNQLRHAMTGRGVMLWFETELPEYDLRTPRELLTDPTAASTLLALAGQARRSDAS